MSKFYNEARLVKLGEVNELYARWCDYTGLGEVSEFYLTRQDGHDLVIVQAEVSTGDSYELKEFCHGDLDEAIHQLTDAVVEAKIAYEQERAKARTAAQKPVEGPLLVFERDPTSADVIRAAKAGGGDIECGFIKWGKVGPGN